MNIFDQIEKLEERYRRSIRNIRPDFDGMMKLYIRLEKNFVRLHEYANDLQRWHHGRQPQITGLLTAYLTEMHQIHQQNLAWISLYCILRWPPADEIPSRHRYHLLQEPMDQAARGLWSELRARTVLAPIKKHRLRELADLKDQLDHLDGNSIEWRLTFQSLSSKIHDAVRAVLIETSHRLKKRFEILAAQYAFPPKPNRALFSQEKIADWILKYTLQIRSEILENLNTFREKLSRILRQYHRTRKRRYILRLGTGLILLALVIRGLSSLSWNYRIWDLLLLNIKIFLQQDNAAIVLLEHKRFFDERIQTIHSDYSETKILDHIRTFQDQKIFENETGYYYFSDKILKGFFLLMSDGSASDRLKAEVLSSADRLDVDLKEILQAVMQQFERPVIREREFMEKMMDLKRLLVDKGTFLFMFIALKDDTPYLFIFPEEILMGYRLTIPDIERLGINTRKYEFLHKKPIVAYLVEGDRYPFKERAGYFEGQYAVAFRSLSQNPEWTVYHEVGHLIDVLRFQVEGIPIPKNSEVNAMLLPLIWASDKRAYLQEHLVPRAVSGDSLDFYDQSVKGILNGYHLYLAEDETKARQQLISNDFESDRIQRIVHEITDLSDAQINSVGFAIYREPERYLSTAEPGRYIAKLSNVQEIIYGVPHGISKRGFILGGAGFNFGRSGPRFIIESMGSGDRWGGSFSFMSFLNNVFGVIFGRKNSLIQATAVEALTASIVVFVVFNLFTFSLHALGTPVRKRFFYGRSIKETLRKIYHQNPWSDGLSFGPEIRERQLLKQILADQKKSSHDRITLVHAFKATANEKQRLLFDLCLCLAPFNPAKTQIKHKLHDLLFYLPFLGPYLGRAQWVWPIQKDFHRKEAFNRKIIALARSINPKSHVDELKQDFQQIIGQYGIASRPILDGEQKSHNELVRLEKLIFEFLPNEQSYFHVNMDFIKDHLLAFDATSQEFDRLDEYTPGDDIRYIDWKATARSPLAKPMVRKFSRPYGIRIGFWMDMRSIHDDKSARHWARDFIRAINLFTMLGAENILEKIFYVQDTGDVSIQTVNLRTSKDNFLTAGKIFSKVKQFQMARLRQSPRLQIEGLVFYSELENERYLHNVDLTDFGHGIQDIHYRPMGVHRMNIFVIGAETQMRQEIEFLFQGGNQVCFL